jgi:hypothetical protein
LKRDDAVLLNSLGSPLRVAGAGILPAPELGLKRLSKSCRMGVDARGAGRLHSRDRVEKP